MLPRRGITANPDEILITLGGFASKMGLASGPAVTAILLGKDNYELIIMVATGVMVLSAVAVWIPSKSQDRAS